MVGCQEVKVFTGKLLTPHLDQTFHEKYGCVRMTSIQNCHGYMVCVENNLDSKTSRTNRGHWKTFQMFRFLLQELSYKLGKYEWNSTLLWGWSRWELKYAAGEWNSWEETLLGSPAWSPGPSTLLPHIQICLNFHSMNKGLGGKKHVQFNNKWLMAYGAA